MPKREKRVRLLLDFPDTEKLAEFVESLRPQAGAEAEGEAGGLPPEVLTYYADERDIERVALKDTFVISKEAMGRRKLKA